MSKAAVTRVTISGGAGDPLESVRRAVEFADAMVEMGAEVEVTGDLYLAVVFPGPPVEGSPGDQPEAREGVPA